MNELISTSNACLSIFCAPFFTISSNGDAMIFSSGFTAPLIVFLLIERILLWFWVLSNTRFLSYQKDTLFLLSSQENSAIPAIQPTTFDYNSSSGIITIDSFY